MSVRRQRRKGTTSEHSTFTGAEAELTIDTDKNTVVVHNGVTAGGFPLAKESTLDAKVDKVAGKQLSTEDYTTTEKTKLSGIETGATADQTGTEIKSLYESELNTNAFTDAEKTKLSDLTDGGDTTLHTHDNRYYTETETNSLLSAKQSTSEKGLANGYASLDAGGLIPTTQLPSYIDDVLEYSTLSSFPVTGEAGKIYVALDTNKTYRWSGSAYVYITSGAVDSVAGKTGVVTLVKGDIGLGNVDNTSDINKPVSTAVTTALTDKVDKVLTKVDGDNVGVAVINSTHEHIQGIPAFTGIVGINIIGLYDIAPMVGRMEVIISEPFANDRTFIIGGHWSSTNLEWDDVSCIELTESTSPMTVRFAKNDTTNEVWVLFGELNTVHNDTRVAVINVLTSYDSNFDLGFIIAPVASLTGLTIDYTIADTKLKDVSDLVNLFTSFEYDMKTSDKNGYISDSDAHTLFDLTWNESTNVLGITRKAGITSYGLYCNNLLCNISSDVTYQVESLAEHLTPGLHYVYYEDGTIKDSQVFNTDLLLKHTLNTIVFATPEMDKEDASGVAYTEYKSIAQFEAHGSSLPGWDHLMDHLAIGAEYENGLDLMLTLGDGSLAAHCEIGVTSGYTQDEDLRHTYEQRTSISTLLKYYRKGDYWEVDEHYAGVVYNPSTFNSSNPLYYEYNETTETYDVGTLANTEIQLIHIYAIPRIPNPQVVAVIGEGKYADITTASEAAIIRSNLNPLPAPEYKLLYTIAVEAGNFGNSYNAKIVAFSDGSHYVDWRTIDKGIPSSNAPTLQNASNINVALEPTNYTPTNSTVEGHLTGINSAINGEYLDIPLFRKLGDDTIGSGTHTIDLGANGSAQKVTATGSFTLAFSNIPPSGIYYFEIEAVNWGAVTVTLPSGMLFNKGVPPTFTSSGTDIIKIKSSNGILSMYVEAYNLRVAT